MKKGFTIIEIIISISLILGISLISILTIRHKKNDRVEVIVSDVKNSANLYSKEDLQDEDYDIKGFSIIDVETLYSEGFINENDYEYIETLSDEYKKVLLQKENDGFNQIYYPYQSPAYYIEFLNTIIYRGSDISTIDNNFIVYNEYKEEQGNESISNLHCNYDDIVSSGTTFVSNTLELKEYEITCTYQSEFNGEKLDRTAKRTVEVRKEPTFSVEFLNNDIYYSENFSSCLNDDYEVYDESGNKVSVSDVGSVTCNYGSDSANSIGTKNVDCTYSFNYNGIPINGNTTRTINIKSNSVTYPSITYYVDGRNTSINYRTWYKNMTLKISKGTNEETYVGDTKISGDTYSITSNGNHYLSVQNKLITPCGNTFTSTTNNASFKIDNAAPTVTTTILSKTNFYENIQFTLTDNHSGLYQYAYSKNSTCSDVTKWTSISGTSSNVTNQYRYNGDNYICVRDNAGNQTNKKITISGLSGIDISYKCTNVYKPSFYCVETRSADNFRTYITSQYQLNTSKSYITDYGTDRRLGSYSINSDGYYVYEVYLHSKKHGTGYNKYYVYYHLYDINGNYMYLEDKNDSNNFVG